MGGSSKHVDHKSGLIWREGETPSYGVNGNHDKTTSGFSDTLVFTQTCKYEIVYVCIYVIYIEGLRQGTFSFVVLLRSSVCLKDPHWNTTDDERRRREKNEQKGFKGSSTGPPGEEIPRVPLRDLRGEKNKIK